MSGVHTAGVIRGRDGAYAMLTRFKPETWVVVGSDNTVVCEADSWDAARAELARAEKQAAANAAEHLRLGLPTTRHVPREQRPRVVLGHSHTKRKHWNV